MSEKEILLQQRNIIFVTVAVTLGIFYSVKRVKHFVNVHLHCIVSNLKRLSKMSTLPPPGKISAGAHAYPS